MFKVLTLYRALTALGCGAALTACSASSSGLNPAAGAVDVVGQLPPADAQALPSREFRLGPYDSIAVNILNAAELNREGQIDGSGNFSLPLIGSVQAAGRTPAELSDLIRDRLRERYMREPQVSVNIREVVSQVVTLDGEVRQPGRYPVIGDMTLQQAIASARGVSDDAALSEVVVFRTVGDRRMAGLFSLKDIREGLYADPDIYSGDVVVVGTSRARRLFRDLAGIAPIFSVFTPLAYAR